MLADIEQGFVRIAVLYTAFLVAIVAAIVGVVVLVVVITGGKMGLHRFRLIRAAGAIRAKRYRPDGKRYPPESRGLCSECRRASERVYVLPDNRRLCVACYHRQEGLDIPGNLQPPG